ncbi:MAG: hypothetical protein AAF658_11330, partial [Myxococcota bacterium]
MNEKVDEVAIKLQPGESLDLLEDTSRVRLFRAEIVNADGPRIVRFEETQREQHIIEFRLKRRVRLQPGVSLQLEYRLQGWESVSHVEFGWIAETRFFGVRSNRPEQGRGFEETIDHGGYSFFPSPTENTASAGPATVDGARLVVHGRTDDAASVILDVAQILRRDEPSFDSNTAPASLSELRRWYPQRSELAHGSLDDLLFYLRAYESNYRARADAFIENGVVDLGKSDPFPVPTDGDVSAAVRELT